MPGTTAATVPDPLTFDGRGLIPVVVQDRATGDVLMVAWATLEALQKTAQTGYAHFWSRRREALWRKGETSGNGLLVREMRTDCDRDVVLMLAEPEGPACHTGTRTCFGDETLTKAGVIGELSRVIASRAADRPAGSYTAKLMDRGLDAILKKIGEEAVEVVIAAKGESDQRLAEEGADLLYHLVVALAQRGVPFSRVLDVLRERRSRPA